MEVAGHIGTPIASASQQAGTTRAAVAPRLSPRRCCTINTRNRITLPLSAQSLAPRQKCNVIASRPAWRPSSALGDGSDGGDGGGGGGGGGDSGDDDAEDGSSGGFGGNVSVLLTFAAACLASFAVWQKVKDKESASQGQEYDTDDVRTLKRLLREVFADLLKVRGRLAQLESAAGLSSEADDTTADASLLRSPPSASSSAADASGSGSLLRSSGLQGALKLGGGLLWAEDADAEAGAADSVQALGVRLGTDLLLQLGGPVRGGADSVSADVVIDPIDETVSLRKMVYRCRPAPGLNLVVAPFGARGQDAAYTLNPAAGRGLSAAVKHGNPLHQRVMGSLACLGLDLRRAWLSAAYFSQATGGEPVETLMAQAAIAPLRALSLGLTVLEPRAKAGTPDGDGRAVPLGMRTPAGADAVGAALSPPTERQFGATAALRLVGGMAVHGWAAAGAAAVQRTAIEEGEWGASLSSLPGPSGHGWALGAARIASLSPALEGAEGRRVLEPNMYELSAQIDMGGGLLLTPGVVVMRQRGRNTVYAGIKTCWLFN